MGAEGGIQGLSPAEATGATGLETNYRAVSWGKQNPTLVTEKAELEPADSGLSPRAQAARRVP